MQATAKLNIRKGTSLAQDPAQAAQELYQALYQEDISFALFYCSSQYDLDRLAKELRMQFGRIPLIGCTTAGEITPQGYLNGSITGASIAGDDFRVATRRIDDLNHFEFAMGENAALSLYNELKVQGLHPSHENAFGFLLVDGISRQEESVVSALYRGLGDIALFGGSAADGMRFRKTGIYHEGEFHKDCALFTLVHTTLPFEVFKTEHFVSSSEKMVVTEANPAKRTVSEINGLPAGQEYARLVGRQREELTPLVFATHPVVVKLGGELFVRSIQKVNEDDSVTLFSAIDVGSDSVTLFSAIDVGSVLTLGRGVDMVENLQAAFEKIRASLGEPQLVLGCDCLLRHLELDQKGIKDEAARIFMENKVIGFSTYGEQIHAMHVNQTFTGVAIGHRK
jgi:hypothetical protein